MSIPQRVIPLSPSHAPTVALSLAAAFLPDPVLGLHLFRQDAYKASGAALFFANILSTHYATPAQQQLCSVAPAPVGGGAVGAALWQPPGAPQGLPLSAMLRMFAVAPSVFGFTRVLRALRVGMAVDAVHPPTRHYYLAFLGVDPAWQGKGLGRALLQPVLERADAEGEDCYLENSNAANTKFYESCGFAVVREVELPGGGPRVQCMLRKPQKV